MTIIPSTGKLIFLGNFSQFDTNESNSDYENASALVGVTLSSAAANANVVTAVIDDTNTDGFVRADHAGGGSTDTINGSIYDVAMVVTIRMVFGDGSSADTIVVGYQTQDGDVFLSDLVNRIPEGTRLQSLQVLAVGQTGDVANNASYQVGGNYYMNDVAFVCFAGGTLIRTDRGDAPVETLGSGDLVWTKDHGYQPIRWIGSRHLSAQSLQANSKLRPIRIAAGALGPGTPAQELTVSPQHRILVQSRIAQRIFDCDEVLVPAKHLTALDGIEPCAGQGGVTYYHFLFDRHEIVMSNGAETESLFTGPAALASVGPGARSEILTLFPELSDISYTARPCRTLANGRQGRKLALRHNKNAMPLHSHRGQRQTASVL